MSGKPNWRYFGTSVIGANHLRLGLPNQDALDWLASYGNPQPPGLLAVADGHGNALHMRSASGSRLAVQVARTLLTDLAAHYEQTRDLVAIHRAITEQLPRRLLRTWRRAVDQDLAATPLTAAELANLPANGLALLHAQPRLAYGSTLLATLVTRDFLLYLQLGDGDIVTVDRAGVAQHLPLPPDPNLIGNVTSSLCMPTAEQFVRLHFQRCDESAPALILLASDGYANSFVSEADFLLAAQDIYALITAAEQEQAGQAVRMLRAQLPNWLRMTSDGGSGDDITVGILYQA